MPFRLPTSDFSLPPSRFPLLPSPFSLLSLSLLSLSLLPAADLLSWSAAQPRAAGPLTLASGPAHEWTLVQQNNRPFAALAPIGDYYNRASYEFEVAKPVEGDVWISVGFLDRGYGLVTLSLPAKSGGVSQQNSHNPAIVNSGKLRHSVFRLKPLAAGKLQIYGVRLLASLTVSDTAPALEPLPEIKPVFTLKRPMDLVISAGADSNSLDGLPESLAGLRNRLPLMKALGFNGIESYVKWNFVERKRGVFDWSFYDAVVAEMQKYGLKWFPLLIVGSAYALPDWFYESPEMIPFVCLEHRLKTDIPTIFAHTQDGYVKRFLTEFGRHYDGKPALLGVRLGPSANYGEAQYPATGAWGYQGRPLHTHIGYWAGDDHAAADFRRWLAARYPDIKALNQAWKTSYTSWTGVWPFLPATAHTLRMRHDFSTWYIDAMTEWCAQWAVWAKEAMPRASIYQSSGGWGALEIGTDYSGQTKSIAKLGGGIRMTNENDSYLNNFGNTRLAAAAARFYGARFGTEPAGFGSVRGVTNRIYNALTNDASHLFYYEGNLHGNDQAIDAWLRYGPWLDRRAKPAAGIAVFFNDTANKLRDDTLRYLRASAYLQRVHALRAAADFDLISEQMIADGALDRYQALVMIWGNTTEKPVVDQIAAWVERGGAVFYPDRELSREGPFQDLSGDSSAYQRWRKGETGKGRAFLYGGHTEPFSAYVAYVQTELAKLPSLRAEVRAAMGMRKPAVTFWTILDDGRTALLHYGDEPASVTLPGGAALTLKPYEIWLSPGRGGRSAER